MDHIGFGFENFDGMGQWRTQDGDAPVDAQGDIAGTSHTDVSFSGSVALATALANSPDVQAWVALQATRYVLSCVESSSDASCALQAATQAYVASGGNVPTLLLNMLASPAFTTMNAP